MNKLSLNRETLKQISGKDAENVQGGQGYTQYCPPNTHYTCGGGTRCR